MFILDLILAGNSLWIMGVGYFPFYLSAWGVGVSIGTHLLLMVAHFKPDYDPVFDKMAKAAFEICFALEGFIAFYYWSFLFPYMKFDWKLFSSYQATIFMHGVPIVMIIIEAIYNSIVFNYKTGWQRILWTMGSYLYLQYAAKEFQGFSPYFDADPSSPVYWLIVALNLVFSQTIYFIEAFVQNYIKTGSGLSRNDARVSVMSSQFKDLLNFLQ
ncbi:UNKNOWN [Stylonychia lemnae]|uniref:Uncharacterized protein n=1 Tax=Stylonychia lemnae TaxID=5949 RepID=A0A078B0F2_STYLE|nr:UNKNOWN [Stylonychia lemnae]|eukprot:CDW86573.1 UNKNOWN [Stylonychia lemnae]